MFIDLPLKNVKGRMKKQGWSLERTENAIREYKRFLFIHKKYPKLVLVPCKEVDEIWHAHILHTKEYAEDCKKLFGRFLHHRPTYEKEEKKRDSTRYNKFLEVYKKEFIKIPTCWKKSDCYTTQECDGVCHTFIKLPDCNDWCQGRECNTDCNDCDNANDCNGQCTNR